MHLGKLSLSVLITGLGLTSLRAQAQTVEGGSLFVTTSGNVSATYLGNSAAYDDRLYLSSPSNSLGEVFFNHGDPVGTTKDLGFFSAGTELVFRLHVDNTGNDFYSGDGTRNPDSHAHARVTYDYTPTATLVEFEDLLGGPYNYNDLSFSFSNLQQTASTPEPGTYALLASTGLTGAAFLRRRKQARKAS
jgi:hypothetical protein